MLASNSLSERSNEVPPPWPNQIFPPASRLDYAVAMSTSVSVGEIVPIVAAPQPSQAARLAKVAAYVDAMLWRGDLTVAVIAVGVGISRSALYRHFAVTGGIARYVGGRRALALRRALARRDETRSCAELAKACGFASPSHASRRFKAAFGETPGAYRVRAANAPVTIIDVPPVAADGCRAAADA